ncbi:hypothetical protein BX600DRAFT_474538 [Xylariales sp. PMI_506]|nr:hypothetical protein BX600DRAFT_474538 [Xylariales sp. PMI_506]
MALPSLPANLSRQQAYRLGVIASVAFFALSILYFFNSGHASASSAPGFLTGSNQLGAQPVGTPDGSRVAVIIESNAQNAANLIPIMLHFANVLGPAWSVVLFTLEQHWEQPASPAFARAVKQGQITIRFLPSKTQLTDSHSVSNFLTQPWLWQQLESAHRILMFQLDSIICSRASVTVEDFFDYDFVGAPIDPKYGHGYNGGLSLRNPKLFLAITTEVDFQKSGQEFEDQWFFTEAQKRVEQGVQLPSSEIARSFSVETIYYEKPLGYHQPERWQSAKMNEIKQWCPEVGMLVGRRAT